MGMQNLCYLDHQRFSEMRAVAIVRGFARVFAFVNVSMRTYLLRH
jgi:hypothetical protein